VASCKRPFELSVVVPSNTLPVWVNRETSAIVPAAFSVHTPR
jgi:hypothetical protein